MGNPIKKLKQRRDLKPANQKALIQASGLFQADWYLRQAKADGLTYLNALDHYLETGEDEGLTPNPYFDPVWYRRKVPTAIKHGRSALAHYAEKGWRDGKHPSQRFSLKLYLKAYPGVAKAGLEPLAYHLYQGKQEGKTAFHLSLQPEKQTATVEAMKTIAASGLFDAKWYTSYYADLWALEIEPLQHFVQTGSADGRNPNPYFETHWYVRLHELDTICDSDHEGAADRVDTYDKLPLLHYIHIGTEQGLKTGPQFDGAAYLRDNPDAKSAETPLSHYLRRLQSEGYENLSVAQTSVPKTKVKPDSKLPAPDHIRAAMSHTMADLTPDRTNYDPGAMDVHWVIPDFAPGAGGHMTIFRMVHFLEVMGHKQTVWINNPDQHSSEDDAYQDIVKHFQHFGGNVRFVTSNFAEEASGDAIIATDCWSAYPVMSAPNFLRRFYFVQDHEPSFHAVGTEHILAEQTYQFEMDCICASPWLAEMMQKRYGRTASSFWLAADKKLYWPSETPVHNDRPRIAVYARHFTARRAVELAMLALERVAKRGLQFHVDFFGADLDLKSAPFPVTDHGVASPEALADLFRSSDIGLVFSATNYSLVPQEMMASGLPIVELDRESTRAIFPEDVVMLAQAHPDKIADALETLLKDKKKRTQQANAALKWVSQFSWPDSAKTVEAALLKGLDSAAQRQTDKMPTVGLVKSQTEQSIKASVVIPTYNAGAGFSAVLDAVTSQRAPWPYEILVIDSGSTDGTLEIVRAHPKVRLHEIASKDFNHGATRNLGAELTTGEFIAYLTHDALPYNDRWLYNMVSGLEHYPDAAGAFGKHYAYSAASPFTKKELNAHFSMFDSQPLLVDQDTDRKRWKRRDTQWLQFLHFYSDNNSCFRRSVWEKIPYRRVAFGEDQLWAHDIIAAGFAKLYVPKAIVYHSHDYGVEETFERAKTESAFFKHFFGYCLMEDEEAINTACKGFDRADTQFAKAQGLARALLDERRALLRARFEGYLAGWQIETSALFSE